MKPKATEQIETKPSKRIWKNILMTSVYIFIGIIVIGGFLSASYLLLREILKVMKK